MSRVDRLLCVPGCPQAEFDEKGQPIRCWLAIRVRDAASVGTDAANREFAAIANNPDAENIQRCVDTSSSPTKQFPHGGSGGHRGHRPR